MKKKILLFAFIITMAFSYKLKAQCSIIAQEAVLICNTETRIGVFFIGLIPIFYQYEVNVCYTACDTGEDLL